MLRCAQSPVGPKTADTGKGRASGSATWTGRGQTRDRVREAGLTREIGQAPGNLLAAPKARDDHHQLHRRSLHPWPHVRRGPTVAASGAGSACKTADGRVASYPVGVAARAVGPTEVGTLADRTRIARVRPPGSPIGQFCARPPGPNLVRWIAAKVPETGHPGGNVRHASPPGLSAWQPAPEGSPSTSRSRRGPGCTPLPSSTTGARISAVASGSLARICSQFPKAEVFTLFDFLPKEVKDEYFAAVEFHTSPPIDCRWCRKYYRSLFFLCPFLIEQFDVTGYDAVISSSAAFARGVITRPDQPHLCYVHSPARYAWDEQFSYFKQGRIGYGPKGLMYRAMLHHLRMWDSRTAHGPDLMLANSSFVRARIRQSTAVTRRSCTRRSRSTGSSIRSERSDYYVAACFAAPYKRTDLVVRAFTEMPSRRLIVVGEQATREAARPGRAQRDIRRLPAARRVRRDDRARPGDGVRRLRGLRHRARRGAGLRHSADRLRPRRGGRHRSAARSDADRPTGVLFGRQDVEAVVGCGRALRDA